MDLSRIVNMIINMVLRKVVGRGGESPVVAVVSLTGAAAYTCFANGERACN